jgi:hypothetical protein
MSGADYAQGAWAGYELALPPGGQLSLFLARRQPDVLGMRQPEEHVTTVTHEDARDLVRLLTSWLGDTEGSPPASEEDDHGRSS